MLDVRRFNCPSAGLAVVALLLSSCGWLDQPHSGETSAIASDQARRVAAHWVECSTKRSPGTGLLSRDRAAGGCASPVLRPEAVVIAQVAPVVQTDRAIVTQVAMHMPRSAAATVALSAPLALVPTVTAPASAADDGAARASSERTDIVVREETVPTVTIEMPPRESNVLVAVTPLVFVPASSLQR